MWCVDAPGTGLQTVVFFVWCGVCLFGSRQRWLGGSEWPGLSRGGGRDAAYCYSLSYRTSSHGEYFLLTCTFGYAIVCTVQLRSAVT